MILRKSLSLFLGVLIFCNGCASVTDRDLSNLTVQGVPKTEEQITGEQIHQQILASFYPYTDPKVVCYVENLGHAVAVHAKRKNIEYRFTILYSEKIYATSAPGGHVYVTTGMLNFLESEAELAAVLAHEIGELQTVDRRFSKKDKVISGAAQVGAAVAPMFGPLGSLAGLGLVLLQVYNEKSYKTPEERLLASDRLAMKYLLNAGYDPQALLDVQERFLKAGGKMTPYFYDYYQSRPITEQRMLHMKKDFERLPLEGKNLMTDPVEYQMAVKGIREMYKTLR